MNKISTIRNNSLKFLLILSLVFSITIPIIQSDKTAALSGSSFQAGNIIDSSLFYRTNAMTTSQIQSFLNSKVPSCDTNGTKNSSRWYSAGNRYYTRAEWGQINGNPAPFKCLKSYTQANTPSIPADSYCPGNYTGGTKTAAQIIHDVSAACRVSQKAMLVLIQKEQSLITDDWPWKVQYTKTTGYGCPDSSLNTSVDANQNGCYDEYEGFFKQIYYAARQLRRYAKQPELFNFRSSKTSFIQYNPSSSCGGSNVFIQNSATAALYNYTPYQPNSAALSNLYGTGNNCSAYGNRNFWRIYSDWFGSTVATCSNNPESGREVYRLFSTKLARHYYTTFLCEANSLDAKTSYRLEGVAFMQPESSESNRLGVYRLKKSSKWFWTMDINERNNLVNNHGYTLQGTSFIALTSSSNNNQKLPVYRLYNKKTGGHIWTASVSERNRISSQGSWKYEGIAYYMLRN